MYYLPVTVPLKLDKKYKIQIIVLKHTVYSVIINTFTVDCFPRFHV